MLFDMPLYMNLDGIELTRADGFACGQMGGGGAEDAPELVTDGVRYQSLRLFRALGCGRDVRVTLCSDAFYPDDFAPVYIGEYSADDLDTVSLYVKGVHVSADHLRAAAWVYAEHDGEEIQGADAFYWFSVGGR